MSVADLLDWALAGLGGAFGFVYALNGWSTKAKILDPKDNPRVKYLLYFLGSVPLLVIGAWDKVIDKRELPSGSLMVTHYAGGFLATAFVTVLAMTGFIAHQRRAIVKAKGGKPSLIGLTAPTDYLHRGYEYYRERLDEALKNDQNRRVKDAQEISTQVSKMLGGILQMVASYKKAPSSEFQGQTFKLILENICSVTALYADESIRNDLNINANVMRAVPKSKVDEALKKRDKFGAGKHGPYTHLLVLEHYASLRGKEEFVLPVDLNGDADSILPGAPKAFFEKKAQLVHTAHVEFPPNVHAEVQKKIRKYFAGKDFKSFLSIPFSYDVEYVGVLNIESHREQILGAADERWKFVIEALYPFYVILGMMLAD